MTSTTLEPFYGVVQTTGDALRLIQAARHGFIPRITRRLNDLERRTMIRSGAIFVFNEQESGIKRWTEGLSWSASRIVGNFLVYREVNNWPHVRTPAPARLPAKRRYTPSPSARAQSAQQKLAGSLLGYPNDTHGRFKPNGLVKKTITISVDGSDYHLISYYSQEDVRLGSLLPLTSRPDIMALEIPPELLESTKFRIPPVVHDGSDGRPRYITDLENNMSGRMNTPIYPMAEVPVFQQMNQWYTLQSAGTSAPSHSPETNFERPDCNIPGSYSHLSQHVNQHIEFNDILHPGGALGQSLLSVPVYSAGTLDGLICNS